MSRIRSGNTEIEKKLGKVLWASGLRYRKHYKKLVGKPDFALPQHKIAIFCDSAFWHGYNNMRTKRHEFKRRKKFWTNKINRNIERDKEVNRFLKKEGWKVVRFWDFQILKDSDKCVEKVMAKIEG